MSFSRRHPIDPGKHTDEGGTVSDMPVGYRFLADEWLPDGLKPEESRQFAIRLARAGIDYISVMGGT